MLLIIDANCAAKVACTPPDEDFEPIVKALSQSPGKWQLIMGGSKLKKEYAQVTTMMELLVQLDQAGKLVRAEDGKIDNIAETIKNRGQLRSDDHHIIALAIVSGARLLCSNDQRLHADFTNPQVLRDPQGSVYQKASHKHLLRCRN